MKARQFLNNYFSRIERDEELRNLDEFSYKPSDETYLMVPLSDRGNYKYYKDPIELLDFLKNKHFLIEGFSISNAYLEAIFSYIREKYGERIKIFNSLADIYEPVLLKLDDQMKIKQLELFLESNFRRNDFYDSFTLRDSKGEEKKGSCIFNIVYSDYCEAIIVEMRKKEFSSIRSKLIKLYNSNIGWKFVEDPDYIRMTNKNVI